MNAYDEERLAELISALPPVPLGWVKAAQELPAAKRGFEDIVARAEADAAFQQALVADLEATLRQVGVEPTRPLLKELRKRFEHR